MKPHLVLFKANLNRALKFIEYPIYLRRC